MANAPKTYEAQIIAALITKKITHAEAVACFRNQMVLVGSELFTGDGWIDLYPLRIIGEVT